ncbi:MAG: IclR family transcriptional regulator [Pusillimonas sp.]
MATVHEKTPPAAAAASSLVVNSVQKAFRVLNAFSRTEPRLTLKQIMDKLEIDKSTAQRFTHTLLTMGYLDKDPATKTLGVTVKMLDLAHIYLATSPLVTATMPYLIHLNGETSETINLTVLDGTEVVFVSRVVGNHLLSTGVGIGTRLPAHTSAGGLAIMSTLSDAQLKHLLDASDLRPYTPSTVHEPAKIMDRLNMCRAKGYVMSVGDYFPNDISVGAPVISSSGLLVGGISLSVSIDRYTAKEAESKFSKLVAATAKSVLV